MRRVAAILAVVLCGCGKMEVEQTGTWRVNGDLGSGGENCLKIYDVAVDTENHRLFVHGILSQYIAVLDTESGELIDYYDSEIAEYHISFLAVRESSQKLFLADQKTKKIIKLDTTNGHLSETFAELDGKPNGIAIDGNHIFVSIGSEDCVEVYKTDDLSLVASIPVTGPQGITIADGAAHVALNRDVELGGSGSHSGFAVIDLDDFSCEITYFGSTGASHCAYSSSTGLHYLTGDKHLWAVDGNGTVVDTWNSGGVEYKEVEIYEDQLLLLTRDGGDDEEHGPRGKLISYNLSDLSENRSWNLGMKTSRMALDAKAGKVYAASMAETKVCIVDLESGALSYLNLGQLTASPAALAINAPVKTQSSSLARSKSATDQATIEKLSSITSTSAVTPSLSAPMIMGTLGSTVDKVKVGTAVSAMEVSPDGSRAFVADRLGGGDILVYDCDSGEKVDTWEAGLWPCDLAVHDSREELYVLNHFESSISVLNSSTGELKATIDLGVEDCRSDYLSSMDLDARNGYLYVVLPELGMLVQVKVSSRSVTASYQVADEIDDDTDDDLHEGRLQVVADGINGYVYVLEYMKSSKTLTAFDLNLSKKGSIDLSSRDWDDSLQTGILCADGNNRRIFVGKHVIEALDGGSLSSSSYLDTLRKGSRALAVGEGYILAVGTVDDDLVAYALDSDNYKSKGSYTLTSYTYPVPKTFPDRDGQRLFVGDLPTATVKVFTVEYDD